MTNLYGAPSGYACSPPSFRVEGWTDQHLIGRAHVCSYHDPLWFPVDGLICDRCGCDLNHSLYYLTFYRDNDIGPIVEG